MLGARALRVLHDGPGDVVVPCTPLHATLPLRDCLKRHVATWASGGGRGSALIPFCARCPIGAARLERASWFVAPAPSLPLAMLPAAQRAARDRWALEHLDESDLDPLAEAAQLTPDDRGVGVDAG